MDTRVIEDRVADLKTVTDKLKNLSFGDQQLIIGAVLALDAASRAAPGPKDKWKSC